MIAAAVYIRRLRKKRADEASAKQPQAVAAPATTITVGQATPPPAVIAPAVEVAPVPNDKADQSAAA